MALIKKPVTGMKDILPAEMEIRDYVLGIIRETYRSYGYATIETPGVEHIENLTSKQGGDNEKLIFKILKRGDRLNLAEAKTDADLVDLGLRYDLTLPLCRYYANNAASLPMPFKALQVGNVWRADRPQKGRFRQFVQCDIDVLGDPTNQVEIESVLAITKTLHRILPDRHMTVHINDRAILKGMADYCGFPEEDIAEIFVILDKMDKIGESGVRDELLGRGLTAESVDRYLGLLDNVSADADGVRRLGEKISSAMDPAKAENLAQIMETVRAVSRLDFDLVFDPTMVRGQGYYTGTIFEVSMDGFGGAVAGGGRYDHLVGKFTGQDVPACGISIGFERIITILLEAGFKVPESAGKKAFLYEKGLTPEQFSRVLCAAEEEREKGTKVALALMAKNKKFQKEKFAEDGYTEFEEFYKRNL
jgi:histidyl-tRNA synthetase